MCVSIAIFSVLFFLVKSDSDFIFPDVKFVAYEPEGLLISLTETEGVKLFAVHGNRNRPLPESHPGEFSGDVINPKKNGWSYFNPNFKLIVGDKIYYWAFIQYNDIGYRQNNQKWEVQELLPLPSKNFSCDISETQAERKICKKELIFDSSFSSKNLDSTKWKILHFIPSYPDYEFCSYQNSNRTCYVEHKNLILTPIVETIGATVQKPRQLDLRKGCTSRVDDECFMQEDSGFILPPITSSKIELLKSFKYGKIEIKAKLPIGDWIYPEIYLQSDSNPAKKIWIAYSRGNERLLGNGGDDIGATLLFGGPILNTTEPERSQHLSTKKSKEKFGNEYHRYSAIWSPSKINVLIDGVIYGEATENVAKLFNESMHLVLGVGVGGVTDFPNYYVSKNNKRKPWFNYERLQVKNFDKAKNDWLPTWKNDKSLKVQYVKIWAL